jgi:hypothetical protein
VRESAGTTQGDSIIRLRRQQGFYRDQHLVYRVRIDGNRAGRIVEGETREFSVPPGEHRIRLSVDGLFTSRKVVFQAREGEVAEFTCRPGSLLQSVFMLLVPHRYIRLDGPTVASQM